MTSATTLPSPRPDAVALGEARRGVEDLVCDLPGGNPDELAFQHPWEIRAFAMAVAAHQELKFDWTDFQRSLITSISDWESTKADTSESPWSYYEHWVAALEGVLANAGLLSRTELEEQTQTVLAMPPNRNHHQAHTEPIAVDPARIDHP